MRTILIDDTTKGITIGFRQENLYNDIVYTYPADWDGIIEAFIRKPGETESVPLTGVVKDEEAHTVSVRLTRTDLILNGRGALEYMCTMSGDVVAKSKVFDFIVAADIISTSTTRPDEWQSWVDELIELGAITKGYAEDAEAAKSDAEAARDAAQGYAGDASDSATAAAGYERNAYEYEQAAAGSAASAAEDAEKASQSAAQAGYMFFYIDSNGDLIYQHTSNVQVDFYLENGDLYVEAIA